MTEECTNVPVLFINFLPEGISIYLQISVIAVVLFCRYMLPVTDLC